MIMGERLGVIGLFKEGLRAFSILDTQRSLILQFVALRTYHMPKILKGIRCRVQYLGVRRSC
jgi:hypothetical protein